MLHTSRFLGLDLLTLPDATSYIRYDKTSIKHLSIILNCNMNELKHDTKTDLDTRRTFRDPSTESLI